MNRRLQQSIKSHLDSLLTVSEYIRNDGKLCQDSDDMALEDKADRLFLLANEIENALDRFNGKA